MNPVKQYIENYLSESLFDDEDTFLDPERDKKIVETWIKENYKIIGKLKINNDSTVDCEGSVVVGNTGIESLTNGLFRWGKISKGFYCGYCNNLKSLDGAPEEVGQNFNCNDCNNLENLEGGPKRVGECFDCSDCENLKSLKGAPEKVGWDFICINHWKLKITDSDRKKYKIKSSF